MKKIFASLLTVVTLSAVTTGLVLSADEKDVSSEYTVIRLSADDSDNGSDSKSNDSKPGVVNLGPSEEPSGQVFVDPTNNGNTQGQFSDVYYESGPAGRSVLRSRLRDRFDVDFFVDARGGGLLGYDQGYTALGALIFEPVDNDRLFFLDTRLNIANNSELASNIGFGYRKYHPSQDRTSSVSAWWDWDNAARKPHQQVALNYSSISRYWRMNANGYLVLGNDSSTIFATPQGDPFFRDSFIKQTLFQQNEVAYSGADLEIGGPMPLLGKYGVDWFVGPYYYSGGGEAAVGAKGRFNFQVNRDWEMGVTVATDDIFGTTAQINVELRLPDGHSGRWFRQRPIYEYLYQPTERNYRVNTRRLVSLPEINLLNIKDGTPLKVAHIVPSAIAGTDTGDGTIEDPFTSTEAYAAAGAMRSMYDIILVEGGDGAGTNLDTGIEIFERQRLLSRSVTHDFRYQLNPGGPTLTSMLPLTGTGLTPILSNLTGGAPDNVVTIMSPAIDHCELTEVSGFTIDGANGGVIPTDPLNVGVGGIGISGYNINRNTFENTRQAVQITNNANADPERNFGLLVDNIVNGAGANSNFGFNIINTDTGGTGLPIGMFVSGNTIDNVRGEDLDGDGVLDAGEDINNGVYTNGVLDNGTAISIVTIGGAIVDANDLTSTTQPLGIVNNTITNSGNGMRLETNTGGIFTADVQNNSSTLGTSVLGSGFEIISMNAGSTTQINSFTGNTADNNFGNGAYVAATDSGTVNFADLSGTFDTFDNNSFNGNGLDGFANVANTSGSITFANIGNPTNLTSNSFDGNTGNGFSSTVMTEGRFIVTNPVVNNTFSNNGDNGFYSLTTGMNSTSSFLLGDPNSTLGNTFSSNGATSMTGRGIDINVLDSGRLINSGIFNNTIAMNTLDGARLNVVGAGTSANFHSFVNNTVDQNMGNGLAINVDAATMVGSLDISDNTITSNGTALVPADGININLVNMARINNTLIEANIIDANLDDGINIIFDNSDITNMVVQSNTISNQVNGHGVNILQASMTNDTLDVDFLDNEILDNTSGAGVNVELNGAIQTTNYIGNTITGNGLDGINEVLNLDSILELTDVSGNNISNNGGIGLHVTANDTSMFTVTVGTTDANVFDMNNDAGIGLELFDTSSGSISVVDTTVTNTVDNGATTTFAGDGIGIRGSDGSTITSVVIEDDPLTGTRNVALNNNAGNGFFMHLQDNAVSNVVTIDNIDALMNSLNGLAFNRESNSDFQDVNILNSTMSNNTQDGIDIRTIGGALTTNMFTIDGNILDANTIHGIDIFAGVNSMTNVDVANNMITNSGMNGINSQGDLFGQLTGTWDTNMIADSGQHGIAVLATRDVQDFVNPNINVDIINNIVERSTMDGLNVVSNVRDGNIVTFVESNDIFLDVLNNVFSFSGNNGATIEANNRGEVFIDRFDDNMILDSTNIGLSIVTSGELDPSFLTNTSTIGIRVARRNTIQRSGNDGVFINTTNPLGGGANITSTGTINARFIDNNVSFNAANGYNLLNTANSDMVVSIEGNIAEDPTVTNGVGAASIIASNGSNGIRVENNAGALFTDNDLVFRVLRTAIVGNGLDTTLANDERNGIYLRVGTTGGNSTAGVDPLGRLRQSLGGIFTADVRQNYLAGNGNIDFVSESFVATPNPPQISTANFVTDPTAKLSLRFRFNEGDSIDVTRFGAFYENADIIKSNVLIFNGANSAGTTRRRNAQRLATNEIAYLTGTVQANPAPAQNMTNSQFNANAFFPQVNYNPVANQEFLGGSVVFNGGVNVGQRRDIQLYNNDRFTTDPFGAIPGVGDPFQVDLYNITGTGESTFRSTEATLVTNNMFTNIISDFTTQIPLGPQAGNGFVDPGLTTGSQTFNWSIVPDPPFPDVFP